MLWMVEWLNNFTAPDGSRAVRDYNHVKCSNNKYAGKQIYKLSAIKMGCFPRKLTSGEKALIGICGGIIISIVIIVIIIGKRWNEVKWLLFLHFNIRDKRDNDINLENMERDALISFW